MKVVVDEGVPRQLVDALRSRGIDALRFLKEWEGVGNGALISAVEAAGYTVLLTNDKNTADQQNLDGRRIAIVALPLNRRSAVLDRVDDIADTVRLIEVGQHVTMALDGTRIGRRSVAGEIVVEELAKIRPFER